MQHRTVAALTAIRRILRAAEMSSRDLARRSGLTPSQVVVLQIVARLGHPSAGGIAEAARLSQATVTALLDRLEEKELLIRRRATDDRRRVSVELTEAGRAALAETPDVLQNRFVARFDKLLDWEQASLIASLERVAALLDAEGLDASPILDIGRLDRSKEG